MQEIPLKFAKSLVKHYSVHLKQAGFAAFQQASDSLGPGAVKLLFHLGWSAWALNQEVNRAHIVNPEDGSLLEKLFSTKMGVNTCFYNEDQAKD